MYTIKLWLRTPALYQCESILATIVTKYHTLLTVSLNGIHRLEDNAVRRLAMHCPYLHTLSLTACRRDWRCIHVQDTGLNMLAERCKYLQSLTFIFPKECHSTLTMTSFVAFIAECNALTHIHINCPDINQEHLLYELDVKLGLKSRSVDMFVRNQINRLWDYIAQN